MIRALLTLAAVIAVPASAQTPNSVHVHCSFEQTSTFTMERDGREVQPPKIDTWNEERFMKLGPDLYLARKPDVAAYGPNNCTRSFRGIDISCYFDGNVFRFTAQGEDENMNGFAGTRVRETLSEQSEINLTTGRYYSSSSLYSHSATNLFTVAKKVRKGTCRPRP